ncbi:hypothetical protein [Streptosporangium sp. NPDC006930]
MSVHGTAQIAMTTDSSLPTPFPIRDRVGMRSHRGARAEGTL